jgi:acyl-CoA dehydrogenase
MVNHETERTSLIDQSARPLLANRIGEEGKGFRVILSGMNAERILSTSEYIGAGFYLIDRAVTYANERVVFDRPIGAQPGHSVPTGAGLRQPRKRRVSCAMALPPDVCGGRGPAFRSKRRKAVVVQALWQAANATFDTFGGYSVAEEYGIERHFREARLPSLAPISNNVVLAGIAHGTLGLPKSF